MAKNGQRATVAKALRAARAIVARSVSKIGLAASNEGYPQVWMRDSAITFLGAAAEGGRPALAAFRISLETLAAKQNRFGQIPFLVHIDSGWAEFGSSDGNPWFVIACAHYCACARDHAWAQKHVPVVLRALDWCESQDLRGEGLMASGESTDWADLLANHGQVLFPNVLYAHALNAGAQLVERSEPKAAARLRERRKAVAAALQRKFWVAMPGGVIEDGTHHKTCALASIALRRRPYFLPWVDGFAYGERFDVAGNLFAILTGLATAEQTKQIFEHLQAVGLNRPYPVRVLHPAILPGEPDWREYYKIFNLNLPDQYHNGGIWPWVGGLYVAALAASGRRAQARIELEKLAEAVSLGREGPWEFNEWLHGKTGLPMGARFQAWSAGMFIYAEHAVRTGAAPGLQLGGQ